jgi:hypothetical protein
MKILKIQSCKECFNRRPCGNYWFCGITNSNIFNSNSIPIWCPLEDAVLTPAAPGSEGRCQICNDKETKGEKMPLPNINIPTYKRTGLDDVEIIINEFAGRMKIKIKDDNKTIETECHFEDLQRAWDIIKRG